MVTSAISDLTYKSTQLFWRPADHTYMAIGDIFKVFAAREEDLLPPIVTQGYCEPLLDLQDVIESYRMAAVMLSLIRGAERNSFPHIQWFQSSWSSASIKSE